MTRWLFVVALVAIAAVARPAAAHVGSPDVYFEGDAGPYHLFVTVRMPQVVPGTADVEIRIPDADVTDVTVVPMRLTGPGSELPPTPDRATRSAADPQFFTATLWLMERGSLQVRVGVDGAQGHGQTAIPIPTSAQRTLGMDRTLGTALFVLMLVLALALVSIVGAAVREGTLPAGEHPSPRVRRIAAIAIGAASIVVAVVLYGGSRWWDDEASEYERQTAQPWHPQPVVDGCQLVVPLYSDFILDHDHVAHVVLLRTPNLDAMAHLHPEADGLVHLPHLPSGHYTMFVDGVFPTGFPITGTAELDLAGLTDCPAPAGDDAMWTGETPAVPMLGISPPNPVSNLAQSLHFHLNGGPHYLDPYMGMAGHAFVVKDDLTVFAHLHPNGTIAMPALMLAGSPHAMYPDATKLPPDVYFPYGFPSPGAYHVFVQVRHAGKIETGVFPVQVLK